MLSRSEAKLAKEMLNMKNKKNTTKPLFGNAEEENTIPAITKAE